MMMMVVVVMTVMMMTMMVVVVVVVVLVVVMMCTLLFIVESGIVILLTITWLEIQLCSAVYICAEGRTETLLVSHICKMHRTEVHRFSKNLGTTKKL
jgi:hypothetical protein